MKKVFPGLLVGLALVAGVFVPGGLAYAEESKSTSKSALEITPSGARLTLSPGDLLEGNADHCPRGDDGCSLTVRNIGSAPIKFRVYMSPYAVSGENNDLSFAEEASTTHTQLSRWIEVKNADGEYVKEAVFSAGPNESVKIPYRVTVPDEIPGGSQYAVIWAQIVNEGGGSGIETVGQIGAVMTGRSTENSIETVEISEMDFTTFSFGGPLHASATVENTGNVDFAAKYHYRARTLFGSKVLFEKEDFVAAYMDTTYHINVDWDKPPFLGIFQVEWKVEAADATESRSAVVVVMPVIVLIVVILLLTVIVVWIIIISRKRKERKARKLV